MLVQWIRKNLGHIIIKSSCNRECLNTTLEDHTGGYRPKGRRSTIPKEQEQNKNKIIEKLFMKLKY